MSDTAVKGRLTAWQRWELPTFDASAGAADAAASLPTAAEIEQIHQQAYEEGYQAGALKAREEERAAHEREQAAHEEVRRLAGIMDALDKELLQVDRQVAQNLLDLSLEIARQMLRQALKVKPELLLGVINEAISELPHFNQHAHLILHPVDAELVRGKMGEQLDHAGWKIFEDAQIERGGCRVETAHSRIDASMATRWKRVVSAIGQDDSWLEP